jgi:hypothetical protein
MLLLSNLRNRWQEYRRPEESIVQGYRHVWQAPIVRPSRYRNLRLVRSRQTVSASWSGTRSEKRSA